MGSGSLDFVRRTRPSDPFSAAARKTLRQRLLDRGAPVVSIADRRPSSSAARGARRCTWCRVLGQAARTRLPRPVLADAPRNLTQPQALVRRRRARHELASGVALSHAASRARCTFSALERRWHRSLVDECRIPAPATDPCCRAGRGASRPASASPTAGLPARLRRRLLRPLPRRAPACHRGRRRLLVHAPEIDLASYAGAARMTVPLDRGRHRARRRRFSRGSRVSTTSASRRPPRCVSRRLRPRSRLQNCNTSSRGLRLVGSHHQPVASSGCRCGAALRAEGLDQFTALQGPRRRAACAPARCRGRRAPPAPAGRCSSA